MQSPPFSALLLFCTFLLALCVHAEPSGSFKAQAFCGVGKCHSSCTWNCPRQCAVPSCLGDCRCIGYAGAPTAPANQCKPGYYRSGCDWRCPKHCAQLTCAKSGNCIGYELGADTAPARHCQSGYYRSGCDWRCSSNCKSTTCARNGNCLGYEKGSATSPALHCKTGFYRNGCDWQCSKNCAVKTCSKDGNCLGYSDCAEAAPARHCKPGFYRNGCDWKCSANCASPTCAVNGRCLGYERCDATSPAYHCKTGFYRSGCDWRCPKNCALPGCAVNGNCIGYQLGVDTSPAKHCKTGWYRNGCDWGCPKNCAVAGCTKNGHCIGYQLGSDTSPASHCKPGFYRASCDWRCPSQCQSGCLKNGRCPGNSRKETSTASQELAVEIEAFNTLAGDSLAADIQEFADAAPFTGCKPATTCGDTPDHPAPTARCSSPDGISDCSFYTDCLEKAHPCGASGYVAQFAKPMCQAFLNYDADDTLPTRVRTWFRNVRQCLQTEAVRFVYNPQLSCDDIRNKAFASHVGCYTRDDDNVCNMPSAWVTLGCTIGRRLFDWKVAENGWGVAKMCAKQMWQGVSQGLLRAASGQIGHVLEGFKSAAMTLLQRATAAISSAWYRWTSDCGVFKLADSDSDKFTSAALEALQSLSHFSANVSLAAKESENDADLIRISNAVAAVLGEPSNWDIDASSKTVVCKLSGADGTSNFDIKPKLDQLASACTSGVQTSCGGNATLILFDLFYASNA